MSNSTRHEEAAAAAAAPSEGDTGATSDETSDEPSLSSKRTHGGCRNRQSYGEKMLCMESDRIQHFLKTKRCLCGASCLRKLYNKGDAGQKVIQDLREARFASKHKNDSMPQFFFTPGVKLALSLAELTHCTFCVLLFVARWASRRKTIYLRKIVRVSCRSGR